MTRPAPFIAGTLAALLLLFGACMRSYYAMVERTPIMVGGFWTRELLDGELIDTHTTAEVEIGAIYRYGGGIVKGAIGPAHQLDRLIRPG